MNKKLYNICRNICPYDYDELDIYEFSLFYRKLKFQYKVLRLINRISSIQIKKIDFPFLKFCLMFFDFLRWKFVDFLYFLINGRRFNLFGVTIFCGEQGSGKTMALTEKLNQIVRDFPDCIICTNFGYQFQDFELYDWRQLLDIRNDDKGVVFAIDEIQNEFDNSKWQDFPDGLLSVITQQRKQKIKIYLTSQVYSRVVKQIREQCFEVVECKTFFGRWTREKCFYASDYNYLIDSSPEKKYKMPKKWKYSFIQSDFLRNCYDSYAVVEKMKNKDFIKKERSFS